MTHIPLREGMKDITSMTEGLKSLLDSGGIMMRQIVQRDTAKAVNNLSLT